MARPRKAVTRPDLTPGQASYVLDRLLADRRISSAELSQYVSDMHREIADLETRLQSLRAASGVQTQSAGTAAQSGGAAPVRRRGRRPRAAAAEAPATQAAPARGRRRRGSAISPEQLASRQLQGRYLGLIRQIPGSKRAQYQKIARDRGREAAIKEMQDVLKK